MLIRTKIWLLQWFLFFQKKNNRKKGLKRTFFTKKRPFLCPKINNGPFKDRSPLKRTELHALNLANLANMQT